MKKPQSRQEALVLAGAITAGALVSGVGVAAGDSSGDERLVNDGCTLLNSQDIYNDDEPVVGVHYLTDSRTGEIHVPWPLQCAPWATPCDYQAFQAVLFPNSSAGWQFAEYGNFHQGCWYLPGVSQTFASYTDTSYPDQTKIRHKWQSNHTNGWQLIGDSVLD